MDIVLSVAGVLVILLGLRDMFHSLLHPKGQGGLSRGVLTGLWHSHMGWLFDRAGHAVTTGS